MAVACRAFEKRITRKFWWTLSERNKSDHIFFRGGNLHCCTTVLNRTERSFLYLEILKLTHFVSLNACVPHCKIQLSWSMLDCSFKTSARVSIEIEFYFVIFILLRMCFVIEFYFVVFILLRMYWIPLDLIRFKNCIAQGCCCVFLCVWPVDIWNQKLQQKTKEI